MRAVRSVSDNTFVFYSSSTPSNDGLGTTGTSCVGDFDRQDVKIRGCRDTRGQKTSLSIVHDKLRLGYDLVPLSAAVE